MKAHTKHAQIKRPNLGQFGRNEWAILGTNCSNIQQLANEVINKLSPKYQLAYIDADHKSQDENGLDDLPKAMIYTDKIAYHRFDFQASMETYHYRMWLNEADVILVNGNHFKANKQIVVIDPKKTESLSRKLDRLTDVQAFIMTENTDDIFDFLKKHIPHHADTPVFRLSEINTIAHFLQEKITKNTPTLKGLILAGGRSTRMGQDKGLIKYFGQPHREYMHQLIAPFCETTYLSCRPDQATDIGDFPTIQDTFYGLGPMGAILSAFREDPDAAWLVLACDYPLMNEATIRQLVDSRNSAQVATAFKSPHNEFPEPLISIWESKSYPILLQFLAQGYACPRKVLINSRVELIDPSQPEVFQNINHKKEYIEILKTLNI